MAAFLGAFSLIGFFRDLKDIFSDSKGRTILLMVFSLILIGTVFSAWLKNGVWSIPSTSQS